MTAATDRWLRQLSRAHYDWMESGLREQRKRLGLKGRFSGLYNRDQWVEPLRAFLRNNSDKSPEELRDMAAKLTPGPHRNNARLFYEAMGVMSDPCPYLRAAVIAHTWTGGKMGFQHLPDPRTADPDDYEFEADELALQLREVPPTAILVDEDRAFYDSLPERLTVYRGGAGIDAGMAGRGMCWTTRRDIAEWFANRAVRDEGEPILVTARVRKSDVLLAFASEHEVVVKPRRWRQLKCPRRDIVKHRPVFGWRMAGDQPELESMEA
ncbi:hypothetical protein [Heyndrickxia sporothermodurans]